VRRQKFSRNVMIGSGSQDLLRDDKISLVISVSNLGDIILEMSGKSIAK